MMFGDRDSESPRVPSPWIHGGRRTSSSRSSSHNQTPPSSTPTTGAAALGADKKVGLASRASLNASPGSCSPLSRAVHERTLQRATGRHSSSSTEILHDGNVEDGGGGSNSSVLSTPPTEEADDEEALDAFFALDTDLDLTRLHDRQHIDEATSPLDAVKAGGDGTSLDTLTTLAMEGAARRRGRGGRRRRRSGARLAPEPDVVGNLEYKLRLLPPTRHRYDKLLTQLKWRMLQGGGDCTYEIGILDDGLCVGICALEMRGSLHVLASMAAELGASVHIQKAFSVTDAESEVSHESKNRTHTSARGLKLKALTAQEAQELLLPEPEAVSSATMTTGTIKTQSCSCGVSSMEVHDVITYIPHAISFDNSSAISSGLIEIDIDNRSIEDHASAFLIAQEGASSPQTTSSDLDDDDEDEDDVLGGGGEEDEEDDDEDDEELGFTFSLSLDERATRRGLGYQRPTTGRRRCQYNASSAAAQRKRTSVATAAAAAAAAVNGLEEASLPHRQRGAVRRERAIEAKQQRRERQQQKKKERQQQKRLEWQQKNRPWKSQELQQSDQGVQQQQQQQQAVDAADRPVAALRHSVSATMLETGALKDESAVTINDAIATSTGQHQQQETSRIVKTDDTHSLPPSLPCIRLIVEASVVRTLGEEAFIDFASF